MINHNEGRNKVVKGSDPAGLTERKTLGKSQFLEMQVQIHADINRMKTNSYMLKIRAFTKTEKPAKY